MWVSGHEGIEENEVAKAPFFGSDHFMAYLSNPQWRSFKNGKRNRKAEYDICRYCDSATETAEHTLST